MLQNYKIQSIIITSMMLLCLINTKTEAQAIDKAQLFQRIFGRAPDNQAQTLFVNILLDGKRLGEYEIVYYPFTQDVYIPAPKWDPIFIEKYKPEKIEELYRYIDANNFLRKQDLESLGFKLDYNTQSLILTMESPFNFRKKVEIPIQERIEDFVKPYKNSSFSGYLNLRASNQLNGNNDNNRLIWESNLNKDGILLQTEGEFSKQTPWSLKGIRLVKDNIETKDRYFLGTFSPYFRESVPVFSTLMGVGYRKVWIDYPSREIFNNYKLKFVIDKKENVQITLNDYVIFNKDLEPGDYEFSDFPSNYGVNKIQAYRFSDSKAPILISEGTYFTEDRLIGNQEQEISFSTGFPLQNELDPTTYMSNKPSVIGFYRYGLPDYSNIGITAQFLPNYTSQGLSYQKATALGLAEIDLTKSVDTEKEGYAMDFTLNGFYIKNTPFPWEQLYFLELRYFTPGFTTNPGEVSNIEYQINPGVNWILGDNIRMSLRLNFNRQKDINLIKTGYSSNLYWKLNRDWYIQLTAQEANTALSNSSIQFSLNWSEPISTQRIEARITSEPNTELRYYIPGKTYDDISYFADSNYTSPRDYQVGISSRIGRSSIALQQSVNPNQSNFNIAANAEGQRGNVRLISSTNDLGENSTHLNLETAIVFADNQVAISEPVNNTSFVIIYPDKSLKDSFIQFGNDIAIDNTGPAVITRLQPNINNKIYITDAKIPLGADLGKKNYVVNPQYGTGTAIKIGSQGNILLIGKILKENQTPLALAYGKLKNLDDPTFKEKIIFTNKEGAFNLLGLSPGEYEITLTNYQVRPIKFTISENAMSPVRLPALIISTQSEEKK